MVKLNGLVTSFVSLSLLAMHNSIKFNSQPVFRAIKIRHEVAQRVLPSELQPLETAVPHQLPEELFSRRLPLTQLLAELPTRCLVHASPLSPPLHSLS